MRQLPLFPLFTVLFPGMVLPLHIFEARYRAMLKDCMSADREFGVSLIKSGAEVGEPAVPFPVGTIARVLYTELNEEGGGDITTVGTVIFRIHEITRQHPYLQADVELLETEAGDQVKVESLSREAMQELRTYLGFLTARMKGRGRSPNLEVGPEALSFIVAGTLQIDLSEKQGLLETLNTEERLRKGLHLLRRENQMLRQFSLAKDPGRPGQSFSLN